MLQCERPSPGVTGEEFRVTSRREEVGAASERKADEEEAGLSSALLYGHTDSERPIGTNRLYS